MDSVVDDVSCEKNQQRENCLRKCLKVSFLYHKDTKSRRHQEKNFVTLNFVVNFSDTL